jgi:broad specificity phosphatase PhoE
MTRFWFIRHALVEENARAKLYGTMDVELCPHTLEAQKPSYAALAASLPWPARWIATPLSRTTRTAEAIMAAGYNGPKPDIEPDLIEQHLGAWQGLPHADLPKRLKEPAHPFWPLSGTERPPGGESMADVITRVGAVLERLAKKSGDQDIIVVSHGGAIRAAVAHALRIGADHALHLVIQNLSLTRLHRHREGWQVVCVNTMPRI